MTDPCESPFGRAELPIVPIMRAEFEIGALAGWLAFQKDEVQATFFNEFDTQLRRACDLRNGSLGWQMQLLYIRKYLSTEAKYTLVDLGTE